MRRRLFFAFIVLCFTPFAAGYESTLGFPLVFLRYNPSGPLFDIVMCCVFLLINVFFSIKIFDALYKILDDGEIARSFYEGMGVNLFINWSVFFIFFLGPSAGFVNPKHVSIIGEVLVAYISFPFFLAEETIGAGETAVGLYGDFISRIWYVISVFIFTAVFSAFRRSARSLKAWVTKG
jgi:hypothetical protein